MMKCEKCGARTGVINSRFRLKDGTVKRRRLCLRTGCHHRFTTYEIADAELARLRNCARQLARLNATLITAEALVAGHEL